MLDSMFVFIFMEDFILGSVEEVEEVELDEEFKDVIEEDDEGVLCLVEDELVL